jgi:hypothetical protein
VFKAPVSDLDCVIFASANVTPKMPGHGFRGNELRTLIVEACPPASNGAPHLLRARARLIGSTSLRRIARVEGNEETTEGMRGLWRPQLDGVELSHDLLNASVMEQQDSRDDGLGHALCGGPTHIG